jgi:hypothetical protein
MMTGGNAMSGLASIKQAVVDPYSLYSIALKHTSRSAEINARLSADDLRLVVPALVMASAGAMISCGESDCVLPHPLDLTAQLTELVAMPSAEVVPLATGAAQELAVLYRAHVRLRYVGDTVMAACNAALVAQHEHLPLMTTPRARYCYPAALAAPVQLIEI